MECWEYKKGRFTDVEVIAGIFYRRNHQGIQNVSSIRWRDRFTDANANGITRGSKRQPRTMTCPVYRQMSRLVKPSAKVNISPLYRPSPPIFLLFLPHLNSPQLQTSNPPSKKKISLFSAQQVIFLEVFSSQHPCSDLPTDFYQFL